MQPPDLKPGARRAVPVEPTGALSRAPGAALWACEQFDGMLWQLMGMATSCQQCQEFLAGQPD